MPLKKIVNEPGRSLKIIPDPNISSMIQLQVEDHHDDAFIDLHHNEVDDLIFHLQEWRNNMDK